MAIVRGVKTRVSTGAMFSTTFCLASTSHAAMMSAPGMANGRIHSARIGLRSTPTTWRAANVSPTRTAPPSARSV